MHEAMDILKAQGVGVDYMRVRAFPFGEEVERFLAAHKVLFVVEQNRDAQFSSLLTLETAVEKSSCARCCITAACRSPRRSSSRACSRSCSRAGATQRRKERPAARSRQPARRRRL